MDACLTKRQFNMRQGFLHRPDLVGQRRRAVGVHLLHGDDLVVLDAAGKKLDDGFDFTLEPAGSFGVIR